MFDLARLMPDSKGVNFYTSDPNLTFLLKHCLTGEDFARAQEILCDLGAVASQRMDELAETANRSTPQLVQYDKRGQRIDEVVFHPAYHELEQIAYEKFAIAACTHRPGAFGWPERVSQPAKFALAYLAMQAEAGVGQTATIAKRREDCDPLAGDELQPEWELWGDKWFCSNVSAELILTLARPEGAPAGTRGLGLFLVPRVLDDASSGCGKVGQWMVFSLS